MPAPPVRAAVAAAAVVVAAACSGGGSGATRPTTTTPPPTSSSTTTTTVLVTVPGNPRPPTTLSGAVGPGGASLSGSVQGPGGPVPGATVRIERLVRDSVAVTNVQSDPNGQWALPAINGGRYRVRAWRPPDLDQLQAVVLFLKGDESKSVPLQVDRFGIGNSVAAVVPNPPVVGQPAAVVVTVSDGGVDTEGVLHASARPGATVQLFVLGGLTLDTPDTVVADSTGKATFGVHCTQPGPPAALAVVDAVRHPLDLPACR